jgi:hypothetical protein
MNATTMPGFTADASFNRSRAHYLVSAMFAGPRQEGQVVPSRYHSACYQAAGVLVCATCAGEVGCYVCSGPVAGPLAGSYACFWA